MDTVVGVRIPLGRLFSVLTHGCISPRTGKEADNSCLNLIRTLMNLNLAMIETGRFLHNENVHVARISVVEKVTPSMITNKPGRVIRRRGGEGEGEYILGVHSKLNQKFMLIGCAGKAVPGRERKLYSMCTCAASCSA